MWPTHYLGYLRRGIEYFNMKMLDRATKDFAFALQHCECTIDAAHIEIFAGLIKEVANDISGALQHYQSAIVCDNGNVYAHFSIGL